MHYAAEVFSAMIFLHKPESSALPNRQSPVPTTDLDNGYSVFQYFDILSTWRDFVFQYIDMKKYFNDSPSN